ncbi:metal-dependent hydrolase [Armatimonas sp.]|uniref:metal-dependent hydrolase n=1 Tax=Armatimonas sp. TaxID=1872638 RepID=UPI003752ED7E
MTWRTHLAGGLATLWLLKPFVPAESIGLLAIAAGLGALLPDLDARESRIKNLTLGTGIAPFALPAFALHRLLGHRGLLHSLLGLLLVALVVGLPIALYLEPVAAIALLLGYASHLALDASTKAGIPFWFPNRRRVHLLPPKLRITTGSEPEDIVLALLAMTAIAIMLTTLQPPIV